MKDTRIAEIAWLTAIAVLVALGGNVVLASLDVHRGFAAVVLGAAVVAAGPREEEGEQGGEAARDNGHRGTLSRGLSVRAPVPSVRWGEVAGGLRTPA